MKTILCYGDSNTWGYEPGSAARIPAHERWTGVLGQELGEGYSIIEEGLNGRTTVRDDPVDEYKNGREYLRPCLASHQPLDLVIIALGVNDLKARFHASAADIAEGAGALVDIAQRSGKPGVSLDVLLVAPPVVGKLSGFAETFAGAEAKSRRFSEQYRRIADKYGCEFLDASEVVVCSDLDGIHLDRGEHQKLGRAVAARVRGILERG